MTDLPVQEVATYEEFIEAWGDDDARLLWQLLGQLNSNEVLVRIPQWLAEEKAGYIDGAAPTAVVGRIERDTEKAILLDEPVAAQPLARIAHRIHELEQTDDDPNRNEWLDRRLAEHRRAFDRRDEIPELADGWLPKSQLQCVVQRPG